jgi:hypothetical protein
MTVYGLRLRRQAPNRVSDDVALSEIDAPRQPRDRGGGAELYRRRRHGGTWRPRHGRTILTVAAGVLLGLFVAWLRRVPWHSFPALFRLWRQQAKREFWWAAVGAASVAVLVLY